MFGMGYEEIDLEHGTGHIGIGAKSVVRTMFPTNQKMDTQSVSVDDKDNHTHVSVNLHKVDIV